MNLIAVIPYLTSWLALCGIIWLFFSKVAEVTNSEFNSRVSLWIINANSTCSISLSKEETFEIFRIIFGRKHFSLTCVIKTTIYTVIFGWLIYAILKTLNVNLINLRPFDNGTIGAFFIFAFLQNYLTILAIRWIINLIIMGKLKSFALVTIISLISSVLASLSSFFIVAFIDTIILSLIHKKIVVELFSVFFEDYLGTIYNKNYAILFYSVIFFTICLIVIQIFSFLRIPTLLFRYFQYIKSLIDLQEKTMLSLAVLLISLVTVLYLLFFPIVLLFHH